MSSERTLDTVLVEVGEFGKFQKRIIFFVCLAVIYTTCQISYVFTSKDVQYRCAIPGCESHIPQYEESWLNNTVPFKNGKPAKCAKFKRVTNHTGPNTCFPDDFDRENVDRCNEFVYKNSEVTIANDFNITCEENLWKLTLVGTINSIGHFFCLPFAGFISDRYGRRTLLISGLVGSAIIGTIRSFSPNYLSFLCLEFLDTIIASGGYSCSFILGIELVGPERRVLVGTIISFAFALGETLLGLIAWSAQSWRVFLRIAYPPGVLLVFYFWLIPESVRWLLSKGRNEEARTILIKAAKVNGKAISISSLEKLTVTETETKTEAVKYPLLKALKSSRLILRLFICCFCWITCTLLYYGLSLHSVALAGNSYLNFIMTSLIEIPAYYATYLLLNRIGRRPAQCFSFFITGVACFAFIFISEENYALRLCVYLFGKLGATLAFTVMYVFTSEIFPTSLRHSLVGTCSMFGRFGSMVAPQMPLLGSVWVHLPLILFTSIATAAGLLALLLPETLNTKLPDSVHEAEVIGAPTTDEINETSRL